MITFPISGKINLIGGIIMDKKKRKSQRADSVVAPGIDPGDALDKEATESEIESEESTKVTKLVYDEYDSSDK